MEVVCLVGPEYSRIGERKVKTTVNGDLWMDEVRQISNVCIPVLSVSKKGVVLNKNNFQAYVLSVKTISTSNELFVDI